MGKFYDERSKSNNSSNNMMISANKGVIKNIETNVTFNNYKIDENF